MNKTLIDKVIKIAETLGFKKQVDQLFEEMAELIVAINKYKRYGKMQYKKRRADVITEIADVYVMLAQMEHFFNCRDEVQKEVEYKIDRTIRRIEKSGTNNEV